MTSAIFNSRYQQVALPNEVDLDHLMLQENPEHKPRVFPIVEIGTPCKVIGQWMWKTFWFEQHLTEVKLSDGQLVIVPTAFIDIDFVGINS